MIDKKTVLILGAGASVPYGFPTGAELRREILENITNEDLFQKFHNLDYRRSCLKEFRKAFLGSQLQSIDAFLLKSDQKRLKLGKHTIAAFLLVKEEKDKLYPEDYHWTGGTQDDAWEPIDHWYQYLFQRMGPGLDQFEESLKNVGVITFNYDRSLEYYFFEALKNAYELEDGEAVELMRGFRINHVYGLLACPHFLDEEARSREYEPHHDARSIEKAASMISLAGNHVSDETTDELDLDLENAKRIVEQDQSIKVALRTIKQAQLMIDLLHKMAKDDPQLRNLITKTKGIIEETQQKIREVQVNAEEAQRVVQDDKFAQARKLIEQAERICFIGFGYDKNNFNQLGFPGILKKQELFGTGFGLEEGVRQRAPQLLGVLKRSEDYTSIIGDKYTRTLQFLKANSVLG